MNEVFEYQFDLLKQEMGTLQEGIKTYDSLIFTIRGWAITVFSAFVFFAADKQKPIFLGLSAIAVILFWLVDSIYKSIQHVYIHRYNHIEKFLQSPEFIQAIQERTFKNFAISQIGGSFRQVTGKDKFHKIVQTACMFHNFVLYVSMLFLLGCIAIASII